MRYLIIFLVLFTSSSAWADHRSSIYLLSSADAESLHSGFQYALDKSANHQAVDWVNPATGLTGSTLPIRSYKTSYGQICREYLATVQIDGAIQQAFGTACRQAEGGWKIAGEKPVKRDRQSLKFVYVKQPPRPGQQGSPFAFSHPSIKQSKLKQSQPKNFHSDLFHEKIRTLPRGSQPAPEQRRIEQKQPAKLLKLVTY